MGDKMFERTKIADCLVYYAKKTLSNNQICYIYFINHDIYNNNYHVAFAIANKRKEIIRWVSSEKNRIEYHQTGTCGLEGLIWAKDKILEFEMFLRERKKDGTIEIYGADSKRIRVYKYALSKHGYKWDHIAKRMFKHIVCEEVK